jgi:hypothetical protein
MAVVDPIEGQVAPSTSLSLPSADDGHHAEISDDFNTFDMFQISRLIFLSCQL